MISVSYLFEVGPGAVKILGNYIDRQRQNPNRPVGTIARAENLKRAAEAKVNASGESRTEGKLMNFVGLPSGKQHASELYNQHRLIYRKKRQ